MFTGKFEEKLIAEKFVEFDLAAQIGRNMGSLGASSCIIGSNHKKICLQQGKSK